MKLKNIHTRKDFIKTNEIFGQTGGGVSNNDGFANDSKLKDTYLGSLINGMFKGIGWLWRKSKENFVINKLIAQLINEIMRGIILFCFDNDISLTEGKQADENSDIKGAEGEDSSSTSETSDDKNKDKKENLTKEELIEKIKDFEGYCNQAENNISNFTSQLNKNKRELSTIPPSNRIELEKKRAFIVKIQSDIDGQKLELVDNKRKLDEYRRQLKEITDKDGGSTPAPEGSAAPTGNFDEIKDGIEYDFDPKAKDINGTPLFKHLKVISLPEYIQLSKDRKYAAGIIKINDEFTIVNDEGKLENIKVYDVNNSSGQVWYFDTTHNKKEVLNTKLLPSYFPSLAAIKKACYDFLTKYVSEYKNMKNKEKIDTIYMHYALINELKQVQKSGLTGVKESIELLETSLIRNIDENLSNAGTVKIKPEEPKAGKVGVGKAVAMKLGASATVGNILTKRDRDKYKEKEDQFGLDIYDVNLAEIEKTIQSLEKSKPSSDVKLKVSTYVNPYNLKTIAIAAEQLIGSAKDEKGQNNALRLRWNKELSNTYAGFTNIMDIEKINIMREDFGTNLNNKKIDEKVGKLTTDTNSQIVDNKMTEKLQPVIKKGTVKYNELGDGVWCYFSYNYPNDKTMYISTIAPIQSHWSSFGLVKVTSCFTSVNETNNTIIVNPNFDKTFKNTDNDKTLPKPDSINVYFLFQTGQKFPDKSISQSAKVFVLNEYVSGGKSVALFLKKNTDIKKDNITISQNLLATMNKKDFIYKIDIINNQKFDLSSIGAWSTAFNLDNNDFRTGVDVPGFLKLTTKTTTLNLITELAKKLKN
jgi:hypothetical protein